MSKAEILSVVGVALYVIFHHLHSYDWKWIRSNPQGSWGVAMQHLLQQERKGKLNNDEFSERVARLNGYAIPVFGRYIWYFDPEDKQ